MVQTARSRNGVHVRLTDERWAHVTDEHTELAGMRLEVLEAVEDPEWVFAGREGELLAVRAAQQGKHLVVVYRELNRDGFVITAFFTSRLQPLQRRKQLWP